MSIPKVIVWLPFDEDLGRLKEDLSSNQHIVVACSEDEVRASVSPYKLQLLVVGNREKDVSLILSMKELNPALRAVQFGLSFMSGPPNPPYDMVMTRAHPECGYARAFIDMVKDFEAQYISRTTTPPSS